MRSKTKSTSAGRQSSWLLALAHRLNSWLDHYIAEREDSRFEGEPATGNALDLPATAGREDDPNHARSQPQSRSEALEHWLGLVRQVAPEWVALVEQKTALEYDQNRNAEVLLQTEDELTQPALEQTADDSDSTASLELAPGAEPRKRMGRSQIGSAGKRTRSQPLRAASDAAHETSGNTQLGKTAESFPLKARAENDSDQAARSSVSSAQKSSGLSGRVAVQAPQTKRVDQMRRSVAPEFQEGKRNTISSTPETDGEGKASSIKPARYVDHKKSPVSKLRMKESISAPATEANGNAARRISTQSAQTFLSAPAIASTSRSVVKRITRAPQRVLDHGSLGRDVVARKESPFPQTLAHPLPKADRTRPVAYGWPSLAQGANADSSHTVQDGGHVGEFTTGPWPELPQDPPEHIMEGYGLLRGLQHSTALDSEQRGGK